MLTLDLGGTLTVLLAAALAAILSSFWLDAQGRVRRWAVALLWAAGVTVLVLNAAVFEINDDEVFYLADSWAQWHGQTGGFLPLRYWIFRPFLMLGLGPAGTVLAGRISMAAAALACGLLVSALGRSLRVETSHASAAGALAVTWLATRGEMVFLRPEYVACLLILLGFWLLLAPPRAWHPGATLAAGCAVLVLAAGISQRQAPLLVVALVAVAWQRRPTAWALGGVVAGALPTLLALLGHDSLASLRYWNWTLPQRAGWIDHPAYSGKLPLFLFFWGMAGVVWIAARRRTETLAALTLAAVWTTSTLMAVVVPHWLMYANGVWFAVSALSGSLFLSRFLVIASANRLRAGAFALALVALGPLVGPSGLRPLHPPFAVGSQLRLLTWLDDTARGGSVACVAPYHPIRAENAWRLWNAWWYCHIKDQALNRDLNPGLADLLRQGQPRIIQWDPWPSASGSRNVLEWAVARGLLPRDEAGAVAERLVRDYRLVAWPETLPPRFGGGHFLVHRAVALDGRVTELDEQETRGALTPARNTGTSPRSAPP